MKRLIAALMLVVLLAGTVPGMAKPPKNTDDTSTATANKTATTRPIVHKHRRHHRRYIILIIHRHHRHHPHWRIRRWRRIHIHRKKK
jgi:hypothetical protein